MIRVAFASSDQTQVNLHFGAAERFVLYEIKPGQAELVGIGEFAQAEMKGDFKDKALPKDYVPAPKAEPAEGAEGEPKPKEDKVAAKLEFVKDCVAVYAASIGQHSIKRLMQAGIQPIIVDNGHDIVELLNAISIAMSYPGKFSWVDRALAKNKAADRFDAMEDESWEEVA
jgi:nitrogen fixation protein NifX